ncbi:hypothetical protein [Tenacibaculum caenipelagi]|uniref:Uncharacterized protein n=1 Tax=Tenacibaculum caenipelagi TaxID=1325435 RepID=A0A4V3D391_9FLAO|nr:hypothetical protein [Tenacibaculum caenipelagi]TDQ28714.1 hypothetical protein DFQ07_1092 [Tenacibaculum caenipelagi]
MGSQIYFKEKNFPEIKVYPYAFEIKAIDFNKFRKFYFSDLKKIEHISRHDNWLSKLYLVFSTRARIFMPKDPWILRIYMKTGGNWEYKTSHKTNSEFNVIIQQLNDKILSITTPPPTS